MNPGSPFQGLHHGLHAVGRQLGMWPWERLSSEPSVMSIRSWLHPFQVELGDLGLTMLRSYCLTGKIWIPGGKLRGWKTGAEWLPAVPS